MHAQVGALLEKRALLGGDRAALILRERRLTFAELDAESNRAAHLMRELGVGRGDRIAVMLRNGAAYVSLYYAAAKLGAILAGVNWRVAAPEIAHVLADSEPRLFIYGVEFANAATAAAAGQTIAIRLVSDESAPPAAGSFEAAAGRQSSHPPPLVGGGDDPLLLVYTSGTSGRPKGAVLTHRQMLWASATMAFTHDYRQGDVNMIATPLFHVGGLSFATLFVHQGAALLPLAAWDPGLALELVRRERVNHFFAVAPMLRSLLEHGSFAGTDLSSLRWIIAGGAPVPPELIHAFAARGVPVQQTYGATETAGPATVVDLAHASTKAGSIGLPYFHTELRIVDRFGRNVGAHEVGEIQVRAPHVFAGYWRNADATRAAFSDGWFKTGDLGRRDGEGYYYVIDRAKDMIISGGENIYPAEIEAALAAHPAITEAAVIGLPDGHWGEVACAIVVARDGAGLTLDSLREFCAGKIARYKIPRRLVLVAGPLPRNATGKLLKHVLRDTFTA